MAETSVVRGPVTVRPARPDEHDLVGELTVEVYVGGGLVAPDSGYVPELRDARARAEDTELLVAELAGEVVGSVAYCPPGSRYAALAGVDEAEFRMLAVVERARGRGVGRALVEACLDRARAAGLSGLRLVTQHNMPAAHRLYERMGFRRTPERDWTLESGKELLAYHMPL
ncbi:N-acetyltransferase [Actinomadura sp. NBRC 104425]|uniref:GNAT family N-acetyltransferase n=1 Tax=Actinomadura sp. NBRC 104425 TaxID=3032204 RepID=UPI00249FE43C|nr:GNAT family N-acetyltransferase [Actinomadura sp. NBRC 104425]GLZ14798.1 N-acetyltransferase [Actinomadura sp. NBRC 104425]